MNKRKAFEKIQKIRKDAGFTTNNITGEAGEYVAAKFYNSELCSNNQKGYDLIDSDGRRIQVKTRKLGSSFNLDGVFNDFEFDVMAVVLYKESSFIGIIEVSSEEYFANAKRRSDTGRGDFSWSLPKSYMDRIEFV